MIGKKDATDRLDAIEAKAAEFTGALQEFRNEAKALRAIIEAEPKKEPRGLCWVWDDNTPYTEARKIPVVIVGPGHRRNHVAVCSTEWDHAIPLTDSELQEYRGRWE